MRNGIFFHNLPEKLLSLLPLTKKSRLGLKRLNLSRKQVTPHALFFHMFSVFNFLSFFSQKADDDEEHVVYLGRYEAGRTIGEGGYAEVKIGQDTTLQRKVAIKVIHKDLSDHKGLERLEREISFLCCMEHPNIVKLYDVLDGEATAVLIMEYIEGQTLDDFVYEATGHYLPEHVCRYLFKKVSIHSFALEAR